MEQSHDSGRDESEFLKSYDVKAYDRPSVTVDMVIFTIMDRPQENYRKLAARELKVLLVQRAGHPFKGKWALPGGFVQMNESLDDAAARELAEETGVHDVYLEQLYTWGDVGRDPRTRVISVAYMALVDSSEIMLEPGDDAAEARWFTVSTQTTAEGTRLQNGGTERNRFYTLSLEDESVSMQTELQKTVIETKKNRKETERIITPGELSFDHARIISYALDRLRKKVEYTDIVFHLMPEYFTLTQLQQVFETILGTELLKANFRRKIDDKVVETPYFAETAGYRPSKLYKYKAD